MQIDQIIDDWTDRIQDRISNVEFHWFKRIGETIKKIYEKKLDVLSLEYRELIATDLNKLRKLLRKVHIGNIKDIESLFNEITATVYEQGSKAAVKKGAVISGAAVYKRAVSPLLKRVMRNYNSMAKSTATDKIYKDTMRKFVNKMTIDPEGLNMRNAMREAVRELSERGLSIVHYDNGRHPYARRLDSSVRVAINGEMSQVIQEIENKLAKEIQADSFEVSIEFAPAPDQELVQGKIFELEEWEKLQAGEPATDTDGEMHHLTHRIIGQYNCRHRGRPFIIGVSEPSHTKKELQQIINRNHSSIEYNGRKHTIYELTQEQRQLETELRRERKSYTILTQCRTLPYAEEFYQQSKNRIKDLRSEYNRLGDILAPFGIIKKPDRTYNYAN